MEKYLTANQAYELAANYREYKFLEAIEATLKTIKEQARKGSFSTGVYDPSKNTFIDRDSYIQKIKDLGYIYDGTSGDYIFWRWDKRKD